MTATKKCGRGQVSRLLIATSVSIVILALVLWAIQYTTVSIPASQWQAAAEFIGLLGLTTVGYYISVCASRWRIRARGGAESEAHMLASLFRVIALVVGTIALLHVTGALSRSWAAVVGFGGLLLGWSLQAPVSGVAAWALISLKRPFRVGDRVMLPSHGLTGDIMGIGMMYTELNQVGGTVGSEDLAGRSILIPNAMLFGNIVVNYTPQQSAAFVLDEVVVRITYSSDWGLAERILLEAAQGVTGDIIQRTGALPYVRANMYDYGVHMYLRYMTLAKDRPRIAYEITKHIVTGFQSTPDVDFAMPYVFSHRTGLRMGTERSGHRDDGEARNIPVGQIRGKTPDLSDPDMAAALADLKEKIAEAGLLQPIVVQDLDKDEYVVLAGELRLEACRGLGWQHIPCVVKSSTAAHPEQINGPQCPHPHSPAGESEFVGAASCSAPRLREALTGQCDRG